MSSQNCRRWLWTVSSCPLCECIDSCQWDRCVSCFLGQAAGVTCSLIVLTILSHPHTYGAGTTLLATTGTGQRGQLRCVYVWFTPYVCLWALLCTLSVCMLIAMFACGQWANNKNPKGGWIFVSVCVCVCEQPKGLKNKHERNLNRQIVEFVVMPANFCTAHLPGIFDQNNLKISVKSWRDAFWISKDTKPYAY